MPSDRKKRPVFSAIAFGSAMLLSVLLFEARAGFRSLTDPGSFALVLVPYSAVVLVALLLGAYLSRWYDETGGIFEIVAVPLIVGLVSTILAGQALALASFFSGGMGRVEVSAIIAGGLYASLSFVLLVWPAMLVALPAASLLVFRKTDRLESLNAA